jgi:hypothetical protein
LAVLFLAAFVVYNANFQRIASGDTVPASFLPFSLLLDGSLSLERFYPYVRERYPQHARAFYVKDGRPYSGYPIGAALLVTPLYAPVAVAAKFQRWPAPRLAVAAAVLEKISASAVAAASVVVFYLLALGLGAPRHAWLAALAYAFGASTWSISSQALWQHGAGQLAILAALCWLRAWERQPRNSRLVLCGLACGFAAVVRPSNALLLAAATVAVALAGHGRRLWLLWSAPAAMGALLLGYNLHVFGNPAGAYGGGLTGQAWAGLAGLLFSPARGLFVYTPLAVFWVAGLVLWPLSGRPLRSPVYVTSLLFVLGSLAILCKWPIWWGGHCYGPRLLTEVTTCLALLLIPALEFAEHRPAWRITLAAACILSVGIQWVGAFCYPGSHWDEEPVAVGRDPARLWDWSDNPILRSLKAGPRIGPDASQWPVLLRDFRGGAASGL